MDEVLNQIQERLLQPLAFVLLFVYSLLVLQPLLLLLYWALREASEGW